MAAIHLAVTNPRISNELIRMLKVSTDVPVECVERPDCGCEGCCVLVVDAESLERMPRPLAHPERMVLIARDEPAQIKDAWEAGVNSVVYERDPLSTVVLAILAACLRQTRPRVSQA